ncbi:hypothetical protein [Brucella gallinifaecis]|uniref:hypothetical protein n=1 Tax=Brucella gallinifaecis TaxID=215590 RepID=UPI002360A826|nr:hypothetical protein [Brucella gallinifaecis]
MTKNIELLLGELQRETPKSFISAANKSPLRAELEKYEDLIIAGIASGHTARGFYEKLKDAEEIKALSDTYKSDGASRGFRQHFIRVFHDYRETLVQEGKVQKPVRKKRLSTAVGRKASPRPTPQPDNNLSMEEKLGWSKSETAPAEAVEAKPIPAPEPIKQTPIIPKNKGFTVPSLDDL